MYDAQIQNELGFIVRENLQLTNTDKKHYLHVITKIMTILIHIGRRQNSSSSYFTSCGKTDSAFDLSECKQESEFKFPVSSRAGAGVTFLGTGAGVKKSDTDHLCSTEDVGCRDEHGSGLKPTWPDQGCNFFENWRIRTGSD